ncbi:unnamed protein product [Diamesa hyperborea]
MMELVTKLFVLSLLGFSFHVQFTSAACNVSPIAAIELEKIVNLMNDSTEINKNSVRILKDIVPLLMLFQNTVAESITNYQMLHEDASLSELLDAIKASVADNIAIMENEVPFERFEEIIPMYHDQFYRVLEDEINCRTKAFDDFKSRRSEVKETCFYNRFGPTFDKLTKDTQSFIKDFIKLLRDGYIDAVGEFRVEIAKWTTDISNALNCGVTGCIANYVANNKDTILKDINIGHIIKDLTKTSQAYFPVKENVAKSMISNEFNGIYEGIKECYK